MLVFLLVTSHLTSFEFQLPADVCQHSSHEKDKIWRKEKISSCSLSLKAADTADKAQCHIPYFVVIFIFN